MIFRYWKPNLNLWYHFEQDKACFFILAMRRWGLFLTLIVLWYNYFKFCFILFYPILSSVLLSSVSIIYPYGLLAALSHKLNNFNYFLLWELAYVEGLFTYNSQTNLPRSTSKKAEKNKHVIHRLRSVRTGKNCALGLTDWAYDVSIMTCHDVTMTSQTSHFEFWGRHLESRACSHTVDNDDIEKYINLF